MKQYFKRMFIVCWAILSLACSHSKAPTGKATLIGNFSGSFPVEQIFTVHVEVPNLIEDLKLYDAYEIPLEPDGSFSLSIPLFSPAYATFSVNEEMCGAVFLSPDRETKVELSLNEENAIQITVIEGQELTPEDFEKTNELFMEFIIKVFDPKNSLSGLRYDMTPEEYKDYILKWTEKELLIIEKNENLPVNLKNLLQKQIKWNTYIRTLFDYEGQLRYMYEHQDPGKETNDTLFSPVKPDKAYYSFLRFFDLNNPPEFASTAYRGIYAAILNTEALNIPRINTQALADWLKEVKTIMADLVGSDTGLFYDFLATHAYLQQFEELKPLSDRQKKEIKAYFKNPTFTEFLLAENEATIKQSNLSSIVKETPRVEKEKVMEAIVSQYKGKVLVVDFWATWCGPCLQAMQEIKPLKEELRTKNVVFVYITETSSPVELWKKKILGIDGEHYYLSEEESKYIYNHFGIKAIPSYQIYDSTGLLKHQIEGFPGTEEMRKRIEELLL